MTVSPTIVALAREVELIKQQLTSVFRLLAQQAKPRDPSINGFCARHGISRRTYVNMRKDGITPRETAASDRRITITEEAEAEWIAEREAEAESRKERRWQAKSEAAEVRA